MRDRYTSKIVSNKEKQRIAKVRVIRQKYSIYKSFERDAMDRYYGRTVNTILGIMLIWSIYHVIMAKYHTYWNVYFNTNYIIIPYPRNKSINPKQQFPTSIYGLNVNAIGIIYGSRMERRSSPYAPICNGKLHSTWHCVYSQWVKFSIHKMNSIDTWAHAFNIFTSQAATAERVFRNKAARPHTLLESFDRISKYIIYSYNTCHYIRRPTEPPQQHAVSHRKRWECLEIYRHSGNSMRSASLCTLFRSQTVLLLWYRDRWWWYVGRGGAE